MITKADQKVAYLLGFDHNNSILSNNSCKTSKMKNEAIKTRIFMNPNTKNNFLSFSKERTKTSPGNGNLFQELKRSSKKENLIDKNIQNNLAKSTFVKKEDNEFKEYFNVEKEILRNELEKANSEVN